MTLKDWLLLGWMVIGIMWLILAFMWLTRRK